MNKSEIIKELISNTTTIQYRQILQNHLESNLIGLGDWKRMDSVISYIYEDGYDITGFQLYDIPHKHMYSFYNESTNSIFYIYIEDFNGNGNAVIAGYINDESCTADALNIKDAIDKNKKRQN